ncbi:hypothetical protein GCM10023088_30720 [Actinomadura verrucosospora]
MDLGGTGPRAHSPAGWVPSTQARGVRTVVRSPVVIHLDRASRVGPHANRPPGDGGPRGSVEEAPREWLAEKGAEWLCRRPPPGS